MKKHLSIFITAGLVMASCAMNEIDNAVQVREPVFASTEAETKTTIGSYEDGIYKIFWSEGDNILIADSKGNNAIYTAASGGTTYAEFVSEDNTIDIDFKDGVIAGYPEKNMFISSTDPADMVYFSIPEVQVYREGSFSDGTMPMISEVAYDNKLKFYNAAGVLKLMLSSDDEIMIKEIHVTTDRAISGECGYIPESKTCFFDETMISSDTVTLTCGDGVSVNNEGKPFYIVVPHQKYASLSITIISAEGKEQKFTMKKDKVLEVKRSSVLTVPIVVDELYDSDKTVAKVSVENIAFDDFDVSIDILKASSYFCGLQTRKSFEDDIRSGYLLESLPYGTPYTTPLTYSGSIKQFQEEMADVYLEAGQTYVLWIIPYKKDKSYTEQDIIKTEVVMKSFTPGGSIEVVTSAHNITMDMIQMKVKATGAKFIYNQLLPKNEVSKYESEQELIDLLLKPGSGSVKFEGSSDIFERRQLRPGAEMTFISVAIDKSGNYGPLYVENLQTIPIEYNSLVVEIDKDIDKLKENGGVLNWSVSEGEAASYRYFYRRTDNNYWTNTFDHDYTMIQEKMVMDPYVFYINHTKDSFATLNNPALEEGVEYVFVVLAVAADETCSVADHWIFTY